MSLSRPNTPEEILPMTNFERALVYATRLHAQQLRKAEPVPYVAHLLEVTACVFEMGGSVEEAIAALLHDAIEDQGGASTRLEITRLFGPEVAAIVDGCSDTDVTPKPPWRERKERYLAHLAEASPSIRRVSLADKVCNLRSLLRHLDRHGAQTWSFFRGGGRDGTIWYYHTIAELFRGEQDNPLVKELLRLVADLDHYAPDAEETGPSEVEAQADPSKLV